MEIYHSSGQCLHSWDTLDTEYIVFTNDEKNDVDIEHYTSILQHISTILGKSMELWVVFKNKSQWGFNRIERYYGIWKKLKGDGAAFRNCLDEYFLTTPVGGIIQTAARIESSEIPLLFQLQHTFNSIWFWIPLYSNDHNGCMLDIDTVEISVKELLIKDAIIIDYLDYSSEGNSLFLKAKKGNSFMKIIMEEITNKGF